MNKIFSLEKYTNQVSYFVLSAFCGGDTEILIWLSVIGLSSSFCLFFAAFAFWIMWLEDLIFCRRSLFSSLERALFMLVFSPLKFFFGLISLTTCKLDLLFNSSSLFSSSILAGAILPPPLCLGAVRLIWETLWCREMLSMCGLSLCLLPPKDMDWAKDMLLREFISSYTAVLSSKSALELFGMTLSPREFLSSSLRESRLSLLSFVLFLPGRLKML